MTDVQAASPSDREARILAIVCYVLFIAVFTSGISSVIGVVLAYVKRGDTKGTIWESHFSNLIHTFWISVVVFIVMAGLSLFGAFGLARAIDTDAFHPALLVWPLVGFVFLANAVWYLYRTIRGLMLAIDGKPYA